MRGPAQVPGRSGLRARPRTPRPDSAPQRRRARFGSRRLTHDFSRLRVASQAPVQPFTNQHPPPWPTRHPPNPWSSPCAGTIIWFQSSTPHGNPVSVRHRRSGVMMSNPAGPACTGWSMGVDILCRSSAPGCCNEARQFRPPSNTLESRPSCVPGDLRRTSPTAPTGTTLVGPRSRPKAQAHVGLPHKPASPTTNHDGWHLF